MIVEASVDKANFFPKVNQPKKKKSKFKIKANKDTGTSVKIQCRNNEIPVTPPVIKPLGSIKAITPKE